MENRTVKTKRGRRSGDSKPHSVKRIISEEDIRRRAYEIYLENGDAPYDELDNWFSAERELREDYR